MGGWASTCIAFHSRIEFAFVNILVHSYLTKKHLMLAPMLSFIFVLYVWLFRVVDPLDHHQGRLMIPNSYTTHHRFNRYTDCFAASNN